MIFFTDFLPLLGARKCRSELEFREGFIQENFQAFVALKLLTEVLGGLSYLGNCSFMFLHQLIHVLLILLHTRLQVVFLSLQTADLVLQL